MNTEKDYLMKKKCMLQRLSIKKKYVYNSQKKCIC